MFRFTYSVALWGGTGIADKYHWRVWGALAVFQPHWVCPHSWCVYFPCLDCSGSMLLYREWGLSCAHFPGISSSDSGFRVLHKDADLVGPVFCVFPVPSSSGSQELDERALPRCSVTYPLHGPSLSLCLVSLLGS